MALRTAFTELFRVEHPIALAPMGGEPGGALAAAVSNGGGFGLVGGGRQDAEWIERELQTVAEGTVRPWGVGFQSWANDRAIIERSLEHGPRAVMLSFGDPTPLVEPVRQAAAALILQVTDMEEARQAVDLGADVIVAQGAEAGGHGGRRSTLPFVPAVVDLAAPTPVLAAGGIAARSRVSDIARGAPWPSKYSARTLRNAFFDQWRGHEDELAADHAALRSYERAVATGDLPPGPIWATTCHE